jgi:hypothetical protein
MGHCISCTFFGRTVPMLYSNGTEIYFFNTIVLGKRFQNFLPLLCAPKWRWNGRVRWAPEKTGILNIKLIIKNN